MENTEEQKLKTELRRINGIQPEDNLAFLINQINLDNITVSDKPRVLNILNEIRLGIVVITEKLYHAKKAKQ